MSSSTYVDSGVNAEPMLTMLPRNWQGDGTVPGVIFSHGYGGSALECRQPDLPMLSLMLMVQQAVLDLGIPVVSGNFGGNHWGNPASTTKITAAVDYMANTLGAKAGRVGFVAQSMGHLGAMNWVAQNLSKTMFVVSSIGVADLANINQQAAYTASITNAYGSAYTDAAFGATSNPSINTAAKYAGLKWLGFAGTDDAVCPIARTTALKTAIGSTATLVPMPGGHTWEAMAGVDIPTMRDFIDLNGRA